MRKTQHAEDAELFRAAVAGAVPIASDRAHHEPPPLPAIPRQHRRDERAALDESLHGPALLDLHLEGGDEAAWLRTGVAQSVLRDLRRGRWVVQAALDLHGMNREEARQHVAIFLAECRAHGHRCVRIVHGKGLRSPGREPVLKNLVLGWLPQRNEILAFCQARAADGGAGAVIVLLRADREPNQTRAQRANQSLPSAGKGVGGMVPKFAAEQLSDDRVAVVR